jgi:hypothetical protein
VSADIDRIVFASREYRKVSVADPDVKTRHPQAIELTYNTLLKEEADAQAFGDYVLGLMSEDNFNWTLRLKRRGYDRAFTVGDTIRVVYPRFGLENGGDFIVKRIRVDTGQPFMDVSLYGPQYVPPNPWSLYKFAFAPTENEFWLDGAQMPDSEGPNLIVNGDGSSTTGWFNQYGGGSPPGTTTVDNGRIKVTNDASAGMNYAYQSPYGVLGRNYRFKVDFETSRVASSAVTVMSANYSEYYLNYPLRQDISFSVDEIFRHDGSHPQLSVMLGLSQTFNSSDTAWFDNVELREITPGYVNLPGYTFSRSGTQGVAKPLNVGDRELAPAGSFESSTGVTLGTGFTVSGGQLHNAGTNGQSASVVTYNLYGGRTYKITVDVATSGSTQTLIVARPGLPYFQSSVLPVGVSIFTFAAPEDSSPYVVQIGISNAGGGTAGVVSSISLREMVPDLRYNQIKSGDGNSTSGWNVGAGTPILSLENGRLRVTAGTGAGDLASQPVTLIAGKTYRISGSMFPSSTYARLFIGGSGWSFVAIDTNSTDEGDFARYFTPAASGVFSVDIGPSTFSAHGPIGSWAEFEDLRLEEVGTTAEWFASNIPAVNSDGYHAYGLLTNYALYSQDFSNAVWTKTNCTVTANSSSAPDGIQSADRIQATGQVAVGAQISQIVTMGGGPATGSVWLKSFDGNTYNLSLRMNWETFTTIDIKVTPFWQRFTVTRTADNANQGFSIGSMVAGDDFNFDILAWQGEVYRGIFPEGGPMIETYGTVASLGASALYSEVTVEDVDQFIYASFDVKSPTGGTSNYDWIASLNANGGSATRIDFFIDRGTNLLTTIIEGGGASENQSVGAPTSGRVAVGWRRRAGKWTAAFYVNGAVTIKAEGAVNALPPGLNRLEYRYPSNDGHQPDGVVRGYYIKQGTFTNAEIETMLREASV